MININVLKNIIIKRAFVFGCSRHSIISVLTLWATIKAIHFIGAQSQEMPGQHFLQQSQKRNRRCFQQLFRLKLFVPLRHGLSECLDAALEPFIVICNAALIADKMLVRRSKNRKGNDKKYQVTFRREECVGRSWDSRWRFLVDSWFILILSTFHQTSDTFKGRLHSPKTSVPPCLTYLISLIYP